MHNLSRKLERKFLKIDLDISIQKAFELLADPKIDILISLAPESGTFYYVTEHEIKKSIQENNISSEKVIKEIATKSRLFYYNQFKENDIEYLERFQSQLPRSEKNISELFMVVQNGNPMGLISDLEIKNLMGIKKTDFKSELDKLMEEEVDPEKALEKFYDNLAELGFALTPEVKRYIEHLADKRMNTRSRDVLAQDIESIEFIEESPGDAITSTPGFDPDKPTELVVTYNLNHVNHRPSVSSPETPERLVKIMELLKGREKVFNARIRLVSDYPPATEEDLKRVHTESYIEFVKNYAAKGGGFLGDSTYITASTHELALLAIGGAIKAAEEVVTGNAEFGLGLIRPPGHHATKDKYGGYCIYNNAAVLARYLQVKKGCKKILILDWDAHAANGTMDIFYDDPTVMLISLHQDPHNYYPKTGFISQMGKLKGLGYTLNVEMPRGSGNAEYLTVFNELVIPLFERFQPDFVIGCNGFDSHHSDSYTDLHLTADGYYEIAKILRLYMRNKVVILMEGGYNPYMGELTHTLINGLIDLPIPFEDKYNPFINKVVSEEKVVTILNEKIDMIKTNLKRYNILR